MFFFAKNMSKNFGKLLDYAKQFATVAPNLEVIETETEYKEVRHTKIYIVRKKSRKLLMI